VLAGAGPWWGRPQLPQCPGSSYLFQPGSRSNPSEAHTWTHNTRISALAAEKLGSVHGLVAFLCRSTAPTASLFWFFPAAFRRTGFSGFLRSGMHTLCYGKRPHYERCIRHFRLLLKRNPPPSRKAVTQLVSPTLFSWLAPCSLSSSPGVVVLIHWGLTFSLAHRNTKWKQFLKGQWNPNSFNLVKRGGRAVGKPGDVLSAAKPCSVAARGCGRCWVCSRTAGSAAPVGWARGGTAFSDSEELKTAADCGALLSV